MLLYRAKCAECTYFKKTKCKCIKHVGNPFQLLAQFREIKSWWSSKEEESFYPSMRELWSFLFKGFFLTELSYSSVIVFGFFFKHLPSLSRNCGFSDCMSLTGAQQLRWESHLPPVHARRHLPSCRTTALNVTPPDRNILVTEKIHFLSLATESHSLTSPWSAMPQYSWFIPILFFKFLLAQQQQLLLFTPPAESTGDIDWVKCPSYLWSSLDLSTVAHSCRVLCPGGRCRGPSTAPGTRAALSRSSPRPSPWSSDIPPARTHRGQSTWDPGSPLQSRE